VFVSIVNEFIIALMAAMNHKCCREPDKGRGGEGGKVRARMNTVETIWEITDGVTATANHGQNGSKL